MTRSLLDLATYEQGSSKHDCYVVAVVETLQDTAVLTSVLPGYLAHDVRGANRLRSGVHIILEAKCLVDAVNAKLCCKSECSVL